MYIRKYKYSDPADCVRVLGANIAVSLRTVSEAVMCEYSYRLQLCRELKKTVRESNEQYSGVTGVLFTGRRHEYRADLIARVLQEELMLVKRCAGIPALMEIYGMRLPAEWLGEIPLVLAGLQLPLVCMTESLQTSAFDIEKAQEIRSICETGSSLSAKCIDMQKRSSRSTIEMLVRKDITEEFAACFDSLSLISDLCSIAAIGAHGK